jgi:protein involved in polysaccharide export with SLBB domain
MKTTPIRPHLLSLLLGTLAVFMIPSGLLAQEQDPAPDPPILPGDHVTVRVWREEDLTGEFLVDQHFLLTLPLIGELDVRGETELSLRERVRVLMRAELRNPSIQVFVLKRVRVLGAVIEPGIFHVGATMSVADALASAGGRTPGAQPGAVILRRGGEIMNLNVFEDARLSDLAVRTGDELLVPEKRWIERNLGSVVTGLTMSAGFILAIVSR